MAIASSYVNGYHLNAALTKTGTTVDFNSDIFKVDLLLSTITGQDSAANEVHGTGPYSGTYRVTYTGASPAGSQTLNTAATALSAGKIKFYDSGAATSAWTTTSTGWTAVGCEIWDSTISGTVGPVVAAINFGSSVTVAAGGTFTITWDATNGIFYATF
jgi:hypothetical protein